MTLLLHDRPHFPPDDPLEIDPEGVLPRRVRHWDVCGEVEVDGVVGPVVGQCGPGGARRASKKKMTMSPGPICPS